MAQYTCPQCGKPMHVLAQNGFSLVKCTCGYQKNLTTGVEEKMNVSSPNCIVLCQKCRGKNRIYYEKGNSATCGFCGNAITVPPEPDPSIKMLVTCPRCTKKNAVPANRGKLKVTCASCGQIFHYDSGTWPTRKQPGGTTTTARPRPQPTATPPRPQPTATPPRPQPTATPPRPQPRNTGATNPKPAYTPPPAPKPQYTRTLLLVRPDHQYKEFTGQGIMNMLKDAVDVAIYLDGEKVAVLNKKNPEVTLKLDSSRHSLAFNSFAGPVYLPAGRESYAGYVFNGAFHLGIVDDPFLKSLESFVLHMVRGQGFRDRLRHPNNRLNTVELDFCSDHILAYYYPHQTRGFSQWASGRVEEKIYYKQVGLTPPAREQQPPGFWSFVGYYMEEVITRDKEADLEHTASGYTFRTNHDLY